MSSVYFNDCRVAAGQMLGQRGRGAEIFVSSMKWEKACMFAGYLGLMQQQLERTIDYTRTRTQAGRPLSKNQTVAHRIVDMKLRLEAARLMLYKACRMADQGKDATTELCMAKLAVSEAAIRSSLDAVQLHGALGIMADIGIMSFLQDAVSGTIFGGASEIQRDLIGMFGLGLPRAPRF